MSNRNGAIAHAPGARSAVRETEPGPESPAGGRPLEADEGCNMTCVEFWNHWSEGSLEASAGSGHLAACATCATRWDRQQALAAGLRLVSAGMRGEVAPPRVEAGLGAAFRDLNSTRLNSSHLGSSFA